MKINKEFKVIDIGHQGYSIDRASTELEIAVSDSIFSGDVKAIKIIHGHGTGALKKGVREWCSYQEGRFQGVIYGEDYSLFNPLASNMRADCGSPIDPDLDKKNDAITYIWL